MQGDRDPFYPLELTVEMYRSLPDAYLWIVPNGSHGPIPTEGALNVEFTNYLMNFL